MSPPERKHFCSPWCCNVEIRLHDLRETCSRTGTSGGNDRMETFLNVTEQWVELTASNWYNLLLILISKHLSFLCTVVILMWLLKSAQPFVNEFPWSNMLAASFLLAEICCVTCWDIVNLLLFITPANVNDYNELNCTDMQWPYRRQYMHLFQNTTRMYIFKSIICISDPQVFKSRAGPRSKLCNT